MMTEKRIERLEQLSGEEGVGRAVFLCVYAPETEEMARDTWEQNNGPILASDNIRTINVNYVSPI
jgi:hypothetical protein